VPRRLLHKLLTYRIQHDTCVSDYQSYCAVFQDYLRLLPRRLLYWKFAFTLVGLKLISYNLSNSDSSDFGMSLVHGTSTCFRPQRCPGLDTTLSSGTKNNQLTSYLPQLATIASPESFRGVGCCLLERTTNDSHVAGGCGSRPLSVSYEATILIIG